MNYISVIRYSFCHYEKKSFTFTCHLGFAIISIKYWRILEIPLNIEIMKENNFLIMMREFILVRTSNSQITCNFNDSSLFSTSLRIPVGSGSPRKICNQFVYWKIIYCEHNHSMGIGVSWESTTIELRLAIDQRRNEEEEEEGRGG